jgi:hypothetical protein
LDEAATIGEGFGQKLRHGSGPFGIMERLADSLVGKGAPVNRYDLL